MGLGVAMEDKGKKPRNSVKKGKGQWCSRERPEAGKRLTCLIKSLLRSDMMSDKSDGQI